MIRGVIMLSLLQINLASSAVGPGNASPLIDSLPGAVNVPPVIFVSSSSPDRLEAAVGLQRLQPGHQDSPPPDSYETIPPCCGPCSQASSSFKGRLRDVSDVDVESSNSVADFRRTLRGMDHRTQQREVNLFRIIALFL